MDQQTFNLEQERAKTKKMLIIIFIGILLLAIAAVGIFAYTQQLAKMQFTFTIDGVTADSSMVYIPSEKDVTSAYNKDSVYFSVAELSDVMKYTYNRGKYKDTGEETTAGYVYSTNRLEVTSFVANQNYVTKYYLGSSTLMPTKTFDVDNPIIFNTVEQKIYVDESTAARIFNCVIEYDKTTNSLAINTLNTIVPMYQQIVENLAVGNETSSSSSSDVNYNNQKALLQGLAVVRDDNDVGFGVVYNGEIVISPKYSQIVYIEGTTDFLVTTTEGNVGIVGLEGTKITPSYTELQYINDTTYVAKDSKSKLSVVNTNNMTIIPADFDRIGVTNNISDDNVTNKYVLLNQVIPVCRNNKWGLYDIRGNQLTELMYDGIGCPLPSNEITEGRPNTSGVIVIPEMNGIVVQLNKQSEDAEVKQYGIVDTNGKQIIAIEASYIYSSVSNGTKTYYYADATGRGIDIVDWYKQQVQAVADENAGKNTNSSNSNSNSNNSSNSVADNSSNTGEANNNNNESVVNNGGTDNSETNISYNSDVENN